MFDYPTVAAIARHVSTLLAPAPGAAPAGGADAAFLSSLLDGTLAEVPAFYDLAGSGSSGSTAVALAAAVARQPAGIMAGGDPTRQAATPLLSCQHPAYCGACLVLCAAGSTMLTCVSVQSNHWRCSYDAMAPVGLARYELDRTSAALVGGNPYRFTSMLQASCGCQQTRVWLVDQECVPCMVTIPGGNAHPSSSLPHSRFMRCRQWICLMPLPLASARPRRS